MQSNLSQKQTKVLIAVTVLLLSMSNVALYASHAIILQLVIAVATAVALIWIMHRADINLNDVGLSKKSLPTGVRYGLVGACIIISLEIITFFTAPSIFKDQRYNQSYFFALRSVFILLPLRTVLLEEFAFRGILLTLCLRTFSTKKAVLLSSFMFGLWHILPSLTIASFTLPIVEVVAHKSIGIAAIVLTTTGAGVLFSILRLKSQSLVAPMLLHWAINGSGIILAAIIWHR